MWAVLKLSAHFPKRERRSERRSNFVSAELSAAHDLKMSAELSGAHILTMSAELSAAHILTMSAELSAAHFLVSALMQNINFGQF